MGTLGKNFSCSLFMLVFLERIIYNDYINNLFFFFGQLEIEPVFAKEPVRLIKIYIGVKNISREHLKCEKVAG